MDEHATENQQEEHLQTLLTPAALSAIGEQVEKMRAEQGTAKQKDLSKKALLLKEAIVFLCFQNLVELVC